ncbi:protein-disulfide reductase DsbD [Massilia endophytica]|uniref:protein-disulfide reductase DsbD n=1 Tax=Massilia endophytica TaxID=2899220 RepID=UPI001E4E580D|nr:protein-disulfide reductase DsbD [Massilia endophytica]UGQ46909.1 protein-disulfide reductase DsbD [Massilia endophytica]
MMFRPVLNWLCLVLALTALAPAHADEFLAPEQAFVLRAELRDAGAVRLHWRIAPGYHLYRERLGFTANRQEAGLGQPNLPQGVRKFDENFNKEMETYHSDLALTLPLSPRGQPAPFVLTVAYQGCADAGLCYPPTTRAFTVDPSRPGILRTAAAPAAPSPEPEDDGSLAQRTLQSGSLWRIGGAFLVFGLLLSFTPCVLPMVPILSSIIVGEGQVTRRRGLLLAAAYSLGMALVYTALGVAAGLAGEGLAGALQKPWVLLTFGALLAALALSMFDVYQLQLPSALQSRLSESSGKLHGGRYAGVFAMGALSALIVGPCAAAPLAGALLYISQTGNAWTGGWALFSMAAGMSVPLLLTGLSAGALLPRAGGWMNGVKKVFGLLLLAVAVWMISPVLPVVVAMVLWGGLAILCAVFLRVGEPVPAGAAAGAYATKALGVLFLLGGLFELVGAASSGRDVLQPLAHLRGGTAAGADSTAAHAGPRFTRIRTVAELDGILASTTQPVLLDFYADWCVACKEMERLTFAEARVGEALGKVRLLQADVTANNADDRALMKRFQLYGPPGIILFDARGKEVPQARVIGFMPPEPFLRQLQRAASAG